MTDQKDAVLLDAAKPEFALPDQPNFWQRKLIQPLISQIKQGATPKLLALSLAWGIMLGIFPILGTTTLLCGIAAIRLKLNHIAIQTINWLIYPLQLLLIIPFLRMGNWIFGREQFPLSVIEITEAFQRDFWAALNELGWVALRGIVAWTLVAIPLVYILYRAFTPVLRHLSENVFGKKTLS